MVDEEESPYSPRKVVSKLQHETGQQSKRSYTASGGRGQGKRATPLVPRRSGAGKVEQDNRGEEAVSSKLALDSGKLHSILRGYGEYPAKYR